MSIFKNFLTLFILLSVFGCAGAKVPIAVHPEANRIYNASYDKVWDALTRLLTEEGIKIQTVDKKSGVISGSKMTKYGGLDVLWGPYKNKFILNISVKLASNVKTDVSIRTTVEMCYISCKPDSKNPRASSYEIELYNKLGTKL